jgi:CheY-like chemotaxis protein
MLAGKPDLEVVGEAENGEEAVRLAERLRTGVVLMDLRMPVMDGVEATSRIKDGVPHTNVLVLTTYNSDADILRAIEAGATGYLLKDTPREELFRAIRSAARGEPVLAPSVTARLMQRARTSTTMDLSGREIEVLELVARRQQQGAGPGTAPERGYGQVPPHPHLRQAGRRGPDRRRHRRPGEGHPPPPGLMNPVISSEGRSETRPRPAQSL